MTGNLNVFEQKNFLSSLLNSRHGDTDKSTTERRQSKTVPAQSISVIVSLRGRDCGVLFWSLAQIPRNLFGPSHGHGQRPVDHRR